MGNLITTTAFIDAEKFEKAGDEVQQNKQREKELRQAERRYDRQQAAETRKRERAEAARWNREIRKEEGRRVRVTAAETKKRERAEASKWRREIRQEERRHKKLRDLEEAKAWHSRNTSIETSRRSRRPRNRLWEHVGGR